MTEITPTYYAAGTYILRFVLKGANFNTIPDDAVAVPAVKNDEPLEYRDTIVAANVMTIESRSANEIVFTTAVAVQHGQTYLGGILSSDRQTVYWVNNTKPLP